jgi:hypothetical protein
LRKFTALDVEKASKNSMVVLALFSGYRALLKQYWRKAVPRSTGHQPFGKY